MYCSELVPPPTIKGYPKGGKRGIIKQKGKQHEKGRDNTN
jgi:hypothetical protein